jgi:hypothetical protein
LKVFEIHQYNDHPYLKVLGIDGGFGEGQKLAPKKGNRQ